MGERRLPSDVSHLIGMILAYLIAHPGAKDTTEGISAWWIASDQGASDKGKVQEAINWLVRRGWMTIREAHPSQTIYGLCVKNIGEIQMFLENSRKN